MQFHLMKAWVLSFRWEIWILSWSYHVINKVCTHYLDSTFIGLAWHQDLFPGFHFSIRFIRSKKAAAGIYGWCQCELGLFSELHNYWTENDMSKLLSTGSCGLHALHGAFKTGEQSRNGKLKCCQLGNMITLMWLEVVNSLFLSVAHGGSKMNR